MGYLKYVKETFAKRSADERRNLLINLRKAPVTQRVEHPGRIDRARAIGYRAKEGIIVVRQRVQRGKHTRPDIKSGRTPRKNHQRLQLNKSYRQIAEEKAQRTFKNCEVLGSYQLAEDGKHTWYEVIMVDRRNPQVVQDKRLVGIAAQRGRAQRGLTAAGRKSRGLTRKGKGAEKVRPSSRVR